MSKENETFELNKGQTTDRIERDERDEACDSFVCIKCDGTKSQHVIEGTNVYSNVKGFLCFEWNHYMLDCNHCKYFRHISWSTGECLKDKQ